MLPVYIDSIFPQVLFASLHAHYSYRIMCKVIWMNYFKDKQPPETLYCCLALPLGIHFYHFKTDCTISFHSSSSIFQFMCGGLLQRSGYVSVLLLPVYFSHKPSLMWMEGKFENNTYSNITTYPLHKETTNDL